MRDNPDIPVNPLHLFLEVSDDVNLTLREMEEMAMTLRGRGTKDGQNRFNFDNVYDHADLYGITEPKAARGERRRQRLILYDLAEEQVKLGGARIDPEPLTGRFERPLEQNLMIFREMRHQLDQERAEFGNRADPLSRMVSKEDRVKLNELTVFENELLTEEYLFLQDQMQRGRVTNVTIYNNELNELRRAARARAIRLPFEMPASLQEYTLLVTEGRTAMRQLFETVPDNRRGLTVMDAGMYDQNLRDYQRDLGRNHRDRDYSAQRVGNVAPLEAQDYMQLALRVRSLYERAHDDAATQYGVPGPRVELIIEELADRYGLTNNEINNLIGTMFNEYLPLQGRYYNFENYFREGENLGMDFGPQQILRVRNLVGRFNEMLDNRQLLESLTPENQSRRNGEENINMAPQRRRQLLYAFLLRELNQERTVRPDDANRARNLQLLEWALGNEFEDIIQPASQNDRQRYEFNSRYRRAVFEMNRNTGQTARERFTQDFNERARRRRQLP